MKKLTAIGLASDRNDLMRELMRLGVVQISAQDDKLSDEEWAQCVALDGNEAAVVKLDQDISQVARVLEAIERYGTAKKPLISTRKPVRIAEFHRALEDKAAIRQKVKELLDLLEQIGQVTSAENKQETLRLSLVPWEKYDVPLELSETAATLTAAGTVPAMADLAKLEQRMQELNLAYDMELINQDNEQKYVSLIYLKSEAEAAQDVFREFGFSRASFEGMSGTAAECITACEQELKQLAADREALETEIRGYEGDKMLLRYYHDDLSTARELTLVRNKLLVTDSTYYLEGWIPKHCTEQVEMLLRVKGCYYETTDPEPEEETPILLQNNGFSWPFESVTKLYALPSSRGIDATPFFSFFYALFFGMMLSDAAYGLIMTIATFVVMKKFRLEGMMKELVRMFFYCGIATMFWGVMFGGYFGDLVTKVSETFFGTAVTIPPLWFNPLEDPMKLLVFSFGLGTVHLFLGMGLSAYMSIRDGKPWDAVFDVGFWYVFLVGLTLFLCGSMTDIIGSTPTAVGMWMAIAGGAGILLTGGRHKKGIGRITGGFGSLYNITGYLSDVLSYSRLLALGLATSVISSVVNTLGTLAGNGILGLIVLIIAFVVGHSYNLAINALGSFVHSCRLQYVEFFGKFYRSGGEAFEPFRENTKYVEIIKEDI